MESVREFRAYIDQNQNCEESQLSPKYPKFWLTTKLLISRFQSDSVFHSILTVLTRLVQQTGCELCRGRWLLSFILNSCLYQISSLKQANHLVRVPNRRNLESLIQTILCELNSFRVAFSVCIKMMQHHIVSFFNHQYNLLFLRLLVLLSSKLLNELIWGSPKFMRWKTDNTSKKGVLKVWPHYSKSWELVYNLGLIN